MHLRHLLVPLAGLLLLVSPPPAQSAQNGASNKGRLNRRPYSGDSPWNLRIGPDPVYDEFSNRLVENLRGPFGCDPTQYTYPVYDRPRKHKTVRTVLVWGVYSEVTGSGADLSVRKRTKVRLPLPSEPVPSRGTDSQLIVINPDTGDEWGFWRFQRLEDGSLRARNGNHYDVGWTGVPPIGFVSRGAGLPYLAGLIRPHEIRRGRIRHALAFGCRSPAALFVYPATKSDGDGGPGALPEGARLQLNPSLSEEDFKRWGLDGTGRIIARALQEYGMILVDGSGHPKIYLEDERTADWKDLLDPETVSPIPYGAFRVLSLETPPKPAPPANLRATRRNGRTTLRWEPSPTATRYRVLRRPRNAKEWETVDSWVTQNRWVEEETGAGGSPVYRVRAVSHNGISPPKEVRPRTAQ